MRDPERLRALAWQIAAGRPHEGYVPSASHVTLNLANPRQAAVTWRVTEDSVERAGAERGEVWHSRRLVIRLYDVTLIDFNGFNANRMIDIPLDRPAGERMLGLGAAGTDQFAEVGCLLQSGEFVPFGRSEVVHFPTGGVSADHDPSALFVDERLEPEPVPSPWEASAWLRRRGAPELRTPIRLALLALESTVLGDHGSSAAFVAELARELGKKGHEVHVLMPARPGFGETRSLDGVSYHPVPLDCPADPVDMALAWGRAAEAALAPLGRLDLCHLHEWMSALVPWSGSLPTVLSLTSTEQIRAASGPWSELSERIGTAEKEAAHAADCVLVPDWLRPRALGELGLDEDRVVAFPLEGRWLDEWECPLDLGQVKREFGLGPLDRVFLFVGPLEWGAGPDLMVEALPALLGRAQNCRLVFVGLGSLGGHLEGRARELGVGHAVRLVGHLEGLPLVRLLRAAEAVVLPSRRREFDDGGIVGLARRAGRPVITTHQGPSHLVAHDQNGLVTFDNPGSMVWAMNQLLSDPQQAELLGSLGRSFGDRRPQWSEVAAHYTELCATLFPELGRAME